MFPKNNVFCPLGGKKGGRRGVYGRRVEIDRRLGSVRTLVELKAMLALIPGVGGPVFTKFEERVFEFCRRREEKEKGDRKENLPTTHPANLGVYNLHYISIHILRLLDYHT